MTDHDRLRRLAENATKGPWHWTPDRSGEPFASDCGPSLENDAEDIVVSAWGHDWWGIDVEDADAEFIAAWNPATALDLLNELRELRAERADLYNAGWRDGHRASPWAPEMMGRLRGVITEVLADPNHARLPRDADRATQLALHIAQQWTRIATGMEEA